MQVIKQSSDQIIIENKPSQKEITIYYVLLFICLVLTAIIAAVVYHLPVMLSIVISVLITAGFFLGFWHTYTYVIDKSEDYIRAWKDNRKIYESDYPLDQIKCIRTTIYYKYYRLGYLLVSLIVVLKNNEEKVINTSSPTERAYSIDIVANKYAEDGKKIAEFLEVPFIEGEYHPPLI